MLPVGVRPPTFPDEPDEPDDHGIDDIEQLRHIARTRLAAFVAACSSDTSSVRTAPAGVR